MSRTAERVLHVSDRLVDLTPGPLQRLLRSPIDPPETTAADALRRVARFVAVLAGVAFVALVVLHLVNQMALDARFVALDADEDESGWSWASIAAEATAGALLALLAATVTSSKGMKFAALVMVYLSLDDFIRIHENLGSIFTPFPHAVRVLWPLMYFPLLGALMIVLWRLCVGRSREVALLTRTGLVMLALAVALEVFTVLLFAVEQGHRSFGYELEVALEEALELTGWILIAGGMATALLSRFAASASQPTERD